MLGKIGPCMTYKPLQWLLGPNALAHSMKNYISDKKIYKISVGSICYQNTLAYPAKVKLFSQ
jgi:hypothetical protein